MSLETQRLLFLPGLPPQVGEKTNKIINSEIIIKVNVICPGSVIFFLEMKCNVISYLRDDDETKQSPQLVRCSSAQSLYVLSLYVVGCLSFPTLQSPSALKKQSAQAGQHQNAH